MRKINVYSLNAVGLVERIILRSVMANELAMVQFKKELRQLCQVVNTFTD